MDHESECWRMNAAFAYRGRSSQNTEKRGKIWGRRGTDREALGGWAPGTNKKPGHKIHELLVNL